MSNDMIPIGGNGKRTMSSLEISDLVESRHDNVKVTIERLVKRGVIGLPAMQDVVNHQNQTVKAYFLVKRDSLVVVAQLSPEFTARVVDRWQELEEAVVAPRLNDNAWLRAALLDYTHKVDALTAQVEEAKPKVAAMGRLESSFGAVCPTVAAKSLNKPPHWLTRWLRTNAWFYRRPGGRDTAYESKIKAGYLENKPHTVDQPDGTQRTYHQALITPKGIAKLAEIFSAGGEESAA